MSRSLSRRIYLLFYIIILLKFWDFKLVASLNQDLYLLFTLAYLFMGTLFLKREPFRRYSRRLTPVWMILAGIFISMIPASLFHDQTLIQSIITYRWHYLWVSAIMLFAIKPGRKEIVDVCLALSVIMMVVLAIRLAAPQFFAFSEKEELNVAGGNPEHFINGIIFTTIPFFYYWNKVLTRFKIRYLLIVILLFLFIFFVQNRSTIFAVSFIFIASLFLVRTRYKFLLFLGVAGVLAVFLSGTIDIWQDLLNETTGDVNNLDYNRTKAVLYFFSPLANPSILTYFLGNGFLSAHSTSLMGDMMALGVYNSDVGFIGYWNQFGIVPVAVFIYLTLKPLLKPKRFGFLQKSLAVFIAICSLTICYFGEVGTMFYFILFYYLCKKEDVRYVLFKKQNNASE